MTKITFSHAIAGALITFVLSTAPAAALALATFVSGGGADGNYALDIPWHMIRLQAGAVLRAHR